MRCCRVALLALTVLSVTVGTIVGSASAATSGTSTGGETAMIRPRIDLTGEWGFAPDVGDKSAFELPEPTQKILVPGAWQAQGYGTPGGKLQMGQGVIEVPYLRHNLVARCLYTRDVVVPKDWSNRHVWLVVRRSYRYTDVEVNGTRIGEYEGFSTPFDMDITQAVHYGAKNRLAIGVDTRARPGRDLRGTANYAGNWGGLADRVWLEARDPVWIDDVFAVPDIDKGEVTLRITVKAAKGASAEPVTLTVLVAPWSSTGGPATPVGRATSTYSDLGGQSDQVTVSIPVRLSSFKLWSPEDPNLYVATVSLGEEAPKDSVSVRFGMRRIELMDDQILLNGTPIYLRGYGDDASEPLTGISPPDKALWIERLTTMRGLGFNYVRHHSMIPNDEYFDAADEVGILVQPEAPVVYTNWLKTGSEQFEKEWPRIITSFRNHPCILNWCMGNEFGRVDAAPYMSLIRNSYHLAKAMDPTRPVHTSDGGDITDPSDIANSMERPNDTHKPMRIHEYGSYCCSLPDFSLLDRLKEGVIQPLTYRRSKEYVEEHKLTDIYPKLYRNSLYLLRDAHKFFIERARLGRDGGGGANMGYSYWLGVDFQDSPEGCWDEGFLNQLWEPKPLVKDTVLQYNGPTVILATTGISNASFYADQERPVSLYVAHYGSEPILSGRLRWQIKSGESIVAEGTFPAVKVAVGERKLVGDITIPAPGGTAPTALTLEVSLDQDGKVINTNSWKFYAYPRIKAAPEIQGVYSEVGALPGTRELKESDPMPADIRLLITNKLTIERHGELLGKPNVAIVVAAGEQFGGVRQEPYFINAVGGAFGGIVRDHPILRGIPSNGRIDPSMFSLITNSRLYPLDRLPQPFADGCAVFGLKLTAWISVKKDLTRVSLLSDLVSPNGGHLLLCGLDITEDRPESRYVLSDVIDYMLSGKPSADAGRLEEDLPTALPSLLSIRP